MAFRNIFLFAALAAFVFCISSQAENQAQAVDVSQDIYSGDSFDTASVDAWQFDAENSDAISSSQVSDGASAVAIPEPSTLVLGGVCALLSLFRRGRPGKISNTDS